MTKGDKPPSAPGISRTQFWDPGTSHCAPRLCQAHSHLRASALFFGPHIRSMSFPSCPSPLRPSFQRGLLWAECHPVPNMFPATSASQHLRPHSPYVGPIACLPIQNANPSLACCCAFRAENRDRDKHISRCSIHVKPALSFYRSGPKGSRHLSKATGSVD